MWWMLGTLLLICSADSAGQGKPNNPVLEDTVHRLQQAVVDLDQSLKDYSDKRASRIDVRLRELEKTVAAVRSAAASSDQRIESRVKVLEDAVTELRSTVTRLSRQPYRDSLADAQKEVRNLTVVVNQLLTELSNIKNATSGSADLIMCEFDRDQSENINTYPIKSVRRAQSKIRGERKDNLLDALADACKKCGPREFKGDYGFYDITTCTLVQCYWVKTGEEVTAWEKAVRLAPPECRTIPESRKPKPPRRLACTMNFSASGQSFSVATIPRERSTLEAIAETIQPAVQQVCEKCWAYAMDRLRRTFVTDIANYACESLMCRTTDDNSAVYVDPRTIPQGCIFRRRR